jgi:uncharacterized repeat protein (TIGR03803 family)
MGAYHNGMMDGACNNTVGGNCSPLDYPEYAYAQASDVLPYFQIAQQYGYANYMFQTNQGPRFPAHQFLLSGTSAPTNPGDTTTCKDLKGKSYSCYEWFAAENGPLGSPYGCTATGAVIADVDPLGNSCGTAYQLQPVSGGGWKEHILHDFGAIHDGAFPLGPLLLDRAGNLYGTTGVGGATSNGTVYRLAQQPDGHWKETILHNFTGGANGFGPGGGVVMDKAGNLYGTTVAGGSPNCGCGLMYKLSPGAGGKWNFKVLHTFVGTDGAQPVGELIFDDKGNLYGNTITGGAGGYGVAFELTP